MNRAHFAERAGRMCMFLLLLGLIFVVGKLCHVIVWPWWLVLLPWGLWFGAGVGVISTILIMAAVEEWQAARERRAERERKTFHYDL